jgi:hypothetical protein
MQRPGWLFSWLSFVPAATMKADETVTCDTILDLAAILACLAMLMKNQHRFDHASMQLTEIIDSAFLTALTDHAGMPGRERYRLRRDGALLPKQSVH